MEASILFVGDLWTRSMVICKGILDGSQSSCCPVTQSHHSRLQDNAAAAPPLAPEDARITLFHLSFWETGYTTKSRRKLDTKT